MMDGWMVEVVEVVEVEMAVAVLVVETRDEMVAIEDGLSQFSETVPKALLGSRSAFEGS